MLKLFIGLLAALTSVAAFAADPGWTATETAHFIIYSKSSEQRIEKLATEVESYDKLIRMATGIRDDTPPVKVRIYEVDDLKAVREAAGADWYSAIAGFYSANALGPYLITPRETGYFGENFTPDLVLHHEYAHHMMLQYFPAAYPGWYTEGFAELIGSSKIMKDGRIGYGMPARQRGHDIAVGWVPLQELLTSEKPRGLDRYAQGWALTHFFTFDKKRSGEFRQYLAALNAGRSLEDAARVFGNLNDLDREARRYVTSGSFEYRPVKVEIAQPVIKSKRPLSAGEAALIPEVAAFSDYDLANFDKDGDRKREQDRRERNLEATRKVVAHYPNDPFALYFLAEAEYASANYAESGAAADRLLAIRPNDVHALARKAMTMAILSRNLPQAEKMARLQQARAMAAKANHLDPADALPLLAYYQSFHAAGEKAPKEAVAGLMQVVSTDPADTFPRELLVDELASEGKWANAMAWLAPLANDPHDTPLRESARKKMDWLKSQLAGQSAAAQTAN
jgi:tetratricopeptide (TPR) repeat protein